MVAGVATDVDVDDGQSRRLRDDDANDDKNGRSKKESNRDKEGDRDYERSFGRHRNERERN